MYNFTSRYRYYLPKVEVIRLLSNLVSDLVNWVYFMYWYLGLLDFLMISKSGVDLHCLPLSKNLGDASLSSLPPVDTPILSSITIICVLAGQCEAVMGVDHGSTSPPRI